MVGVLRWLCLVSVCNLNVKVKVIYKLYFSILNTFEKGNILVKMNVGVIQLGRIPQILILNLYMKLNCKSSLKAWCKYSNLLNKIT